MTETQPPSIAVRGRLEDYDRKLEETRARIERLHDSLVMLDRADRDDRSAR